jgi:hypothetical protein
MRDIVRSTNAMTANRIVIAAIATARRVNETYKMSSEESERSMDNERASTPADSNIEKTFCVRFSSLY